MFAAAIAALSVLSPGTGGLKDKMKVKGLRACRCACPSCKERGKCVATLNGPRDHLHMRCTACGWGMME